MIADRHHIRVQLIDQINRGNAPVFLIDDRPLEHISGNCIQHVPIPFPRLLHIP